MCMKKEVCYIPLTIERKLKNYSECENHTYRHEVLWHEWNHNKRWLMQLQQLILPSFPSYSKHDMSHSEAVLHNIEMLLGEKNIEELSATDCFMLLHIVYVHDIGMCITHADREAILCNEQFQEYVKSLCEQGTAEMGRCAEILLKTKFSVADSVCESFLEKLDVYYAIIYLISEFRRRDHGDVAKNRLISWVESPDKLGVGFSSLEIPSRLFFTIASCAATHTNWDFQAVLDLNQEDTGFTHDYVHPRFLAVLLQLGDALDMDNDRFHPLIKEYLGKLPHTSEIHYEKHKAVRILKITNEEITIEADCKNQEELRLIRMECDGIQSILKSATYCWTAIRPKNSSIVLPTFQKARLLLNGQAIPAELVSARFEISQEKAFQLIEGNNIYKNEGFVFLRELLQNAVDATKIQYFRDCMRKLNSGIEGTLSNPVTASKLISPREYPIKIELSLRKDKSGDEIEVDYEAEAREVRTEALEYGVFVKIRDFATGISGEDIKTIANVGTSYNQRKSEIKKMPDWLQPTGNFGVGLQSAFLAGKNLTAVTHTRMEEQYKISFYPRHSGSEGYINVMPLSPADPLEPYGTCFEIFVPNNKRKLHMDSPETWDGKDPFEDAYIRNRELRHAYELMQQMVLYLGKLIGDIIFPIEVYVNGIDDLGGAIKKMAEESSFDIYLRKTGSVQKRLYREEVRKTWVDKLRDEHVQIPELENGDIYFLDSKNVKLYVWSQKYSAYACFGNRQLLELRKLSNATKRPDILIQSKVFYKGMQVTKELFRQDANLLEYIDLKGTLDTAYLKLNRNGFSQKGYDYLHEVYEEIVQIAVKALKNIVQSENKWGYGSLDAAEKQITQLLEEQGTEEKSKAEKYQKAEQMVLSVSGFACLTMISRKDEIWGAMEASVESPWVESLLRLRRLPHFNQMVKEAEKLTILYGMTAFIYREGSVAISREKKSILDIINTENKYAVISKRMNDGKSWFSYLVNVSEIHADIRNDILELRRVMGIREKNRLIGDLESKVQSLLNSNFKKDLNRTHPNV